MMILDSGLLFWATLYIYTRSCTMYRQFYVHLS